MKGEIIRRMSMEIVKDEGVENNNPFGTIARINKPEDEDDDDYLEKTIGAFGLWHAVVSVTVALTRALAIWNLVSFPFLTPVVDFVCVEFSDNATVEVRNSTCYESCLKYNYSSAVGRSIIEDYELICQKAWLGSFVQSILMMGFLVGVFLLGWISDRFGRRPALLQSTFLSAVFMIALPFSPSYIIFAAIRFVLGIASGGTLLICVVYVMEIVGKRYREIAGACCLIPEFLAHASLAGFAYYTSDWQGYTLSYGVASCFIFLIILFVPESPRWLMANGKFDKAVKAITSAASRNKLNTSNIKAELTKAIEDMKLKDKEIVRGSYLDFFTKTLIVRTLLVFKIWFAVCMCFYGIYQYVTIIGIDPYLTVAITGLIQIPVFPVSIILNMRFGRKISTIGTSGFIALAMLILIFIPSGHWCETMFGILGFVTSNICLSVTYVHVSELYPTPLRNMSYSLASIGGKIGAMVAPFIGNLSPRWMPSVIFCVTAATIGLCCLGLPETKGRNLKDTIEK